MEDNKYKEALERAKKWYYAPNIPTYANMILEDVFQSEFKSDEDEDEKIKKGIISILKYYKENGQCVCPYPFVLVDDAIAWLEKQGEHANFLNKIQVGDKVTRNQDGVLVNLSQLKRVAKKDEKQGEQKPIILK